MRSGQFDAAPGFEHWLLKFDGVGKDSELGAPGGGADYGRIEYAYAQLFMAIAQLRLCDDAIGQAFRRMAFNVAAKNCDDHSKNFAFRLKHGGAWELAPADAGDARKSGAAVTPDRFGRRRIVGFLCLSWRAAGESAGAG